MLSKRFTREDAIDNTVDGVLRIPEEFTILEVDFAYFVVREDLPRVHTLIIPKTVELIESMRGDYSSGPYGYKDNLFSSIIVDKKNRNYTSEDGVLFSKDMKKLICYPCGRPGSEYIIPEGVEVVKCEAFLNAEHLAKVIVPKSVKCIEEDAFSGCEDIEVIEKE